MGLAGGGAEFDIFWDPPPFPFVCLEPVIFASKSPAMYKTTLTFFILDGEDKRLTYHAYSFCLKTSIPKQKNQFVGV
jgi:hypothetical protein